VDSPLEYEIRPDPEPDEAAAIVAAVAQALAEDAAFALPAAYTSRWRQAGAVEAAAAETG
jgi:hypothetical protein